MRFIGTAVVILGIVFAAASPGNGRELKGESDARLLTLRRQIDAELNRRKTERPAAPTVAQAPAAARPDANLPYVPTDEIDPNFTPADLKDRAKFSPQELYIRADPIDGFRYLYPLAIPDGRGATISLTDDLLGRTLALAIRGFGSYIVARDFFDLPGTSTERPLSLTGYALAPFVFADGTLNTPRRATEASALQTGLDAQFEFAGGGLFSLQNFGLRPYVQTDLRGEGSIYGVNAAWEPYQTAINLGGRYDVGAPKLLGFLWRFVAEANIFRVDDPGLSAFNSNREYAFLGGTLQARAVLFENLSSVPSFLCGRIYVNGSLSQFWDVAAQGKSFRDLELETGYILSPEVTDSNRFCTAAGATPSASNTSRAKTSLSAIYNNGTNRFTMEKREQYKVQLSFQY